VKTLLSLFDENCHQLKQRIAEDLSPENVVREVKTFLDHILAKYQKEAEREPTQRSLAVFSIEALKASMSTLVAASEVEIWSREQPVKTLFRLPPVITPLSWWRGIQVVILLFLFIMFWINQNFIYFGLLVVLVLNEFRGLLIPRARIGENISSKHSPFRTVQELPTIQGKVQIKVDSYLSKLADALLTTDKLLTEVLSMKTSTAEKEAILESDADLLNLFQDLLEARQTEDAEFALKQVRVVPFILERYGIAVENYSGKNEHFFEFVPSLNSHDKTSQTLRPALVKDKRPLKRGLVTEPTSE